jgi:hypothetical protein
MDGPEPAHRRPSRLLSMVASVALVTGLAAACGGSGTAPGGPLFSGDPCSLISSAELEAAIGGGNVAQSPEPNHESSSDSGCSWTLDAPGNPVGDSANLTIKSPGGAADFASTRQFLLALQGSPDPTVSAGLSAGQSDDPGSSPDGADLGISLQSVPGLGDDAFVGAAGTVYTIKGDTELGLQLIAFDDPKAQQDTIDLLKKAIVRLP